MVSRACLERFDDLKWLNGSLSSCGFRDIREATGKGDDDIYSAIEALGTTTVNPIDLEIYQKTYNLYIKHGRSVNEIAEILKLSPEYINNCLHKYRIPTRLSKIATYEPQLLRTYRQIRYFTPDLVRLKNGSISLVGPCGISVIMSTNVKKRQSTRYKIEELKDEYKWLPKVVPDYADINPDEDYPHWTIKSKVNSPIEKRVAALRLLTYAVKCKDKWPKHPPLVVNRCVNDLLHEQVVNTDDFWKVVEHFFGNEEIRYYAERPKQMFHVMTDSAGSDYTAATNVITSRSITECLYRRKLRIGYLGVANIVRTFNKLRVIGPVYDPYPGIGCLALACAKLGIKYYYGTDDHIFNRGLENGFVKAIALDAEPYAGQKVNYLISQNLPYSWYPIYGKNAVLWSMVNGGNTHHLKLAMRAFKVHNIHQISNSLRMVNFIPNESKINL